MRRLARWDAGTSGLVQRYVAISQHVAGRIDRYYNRAVDVVYPRVDTEFFTPNGASPGRYFLVVSALVPDKRIDLAIAACEQAAFADAMHHLDDAAFDPTALHEAATRFSRSRFQMEMRSAIEALAEEVRP